MIYTEISWSVQAGYPILATLQLLPLAVMVLLLLQGATLGIFCALDTILFWELTLAPLYFLVSLWGIGPNRRYAAVQYTLFMLAGGLPLLAFNHAAVAGGGIPGGLAFSYLTLLETPIPATTQTLVFFLLLAGFAVKTPLFPFHTWLPVVAQEGPIAVVALLTGLKLGAYGLLRFVVPLAPDAALEFHWLLVSFFLLFGLVGMGVPGTSGFPAEFLILVSAITTHQNS